MKRSLHLVMYFATSLMAADVVPDVSVLRTKTGKPTDPVIWAISGSQVSLPVEVVGRLGSSGKLHVTRFQVSGELVTPIPGGAEIIQKLDFPDRTHQRLEVSVPMPGVERDTTVMVRFSLLSPEGKTLAIANAAIRVLPGPENPLNPVTRLKKLREGSLLVTGESQRIRAFLDKASIRYTDGFLREPGVPAVILREAGEDRVQPVPGVPALLFTKPDEFLPGVYAGSNTEPGIVKITFPVLEDIASDVRAQKMFSDLIFLFLPTQPTNDP